MIMLQKNFDDILPSRFAGTYKFPNHDISTFILLFPKVFYAFEYMGDWKKINEISLREKKDFCSHLNMEYITEADYRHANRACKDFEITDLGKYHGL